MVRPDELSWLDALRAGARWTDVVTVLDAAGWAPCGTGDWAYARRSPSQTYAARISPFDPAAPYTAALYREAAHTRQVPALAAHRELRGGAQLTVMEHLLPVPPDVARGFHRALADGAPHLAELARLVRACHADGAREQRWWGPLDTNPDNVMRGHDGRLVLTDPFYADGPALYRAAAEDPGLVARTIPAERREHLAEIPLAGSGPWEPGAQDRLRSALAAADRRLAGVTGA